MSLDADMVKRLHTLIQTQLPQTQKTYEHNSSQTQLISLNTCERLSIKL